MPKEIPALNIAAMIFVGVTIVAAAVASFARESLRGFSRFRLDEACRRLGRPDRFGIVLKRANEAFLATQLLAAFLFAILAGIAGTRFVAELDVRDGTFAWISMPIEAVVVTAGFLLVFFLFPWGFARVAGERFLARSWPALVVLIRVARPYLALARRIDRFLHRVCGLKDPEGSHSESLVREINAVVAQGHREGILAAQARRIIERVIELQEEDVAAIMTSRTEMDCIPADVSLEEARTLMLEGGHSRMPVIGASTDDIIGILYAKDLLRHFSAEKGGALHLKDVVREPFYIPETTGIDKLLESMKRRGVHIAIVVDEYSSVAGLVTMEDVLEQIVGEIQDEYDSAEDTGIRQVGPASLEVAPWVRIDDLDEQFALDFPEDEDYDTIGGFVYAQLGRIPKRRDMLTWKQLRLTVLDADKRRIRRIRIDSQSPSPLVGVPL